MNFSPSGLLSGNANTPGTYTFTIRVNDSANQSTDATFTIEIASGSTALSISALAPPPGLLYFPYNFSLSATEAVYEVTHGVPRLVNQLCDLAMVYAYTKNQRRVLRLTVQQVLDDGVFFGGGTRGGPVFRSTQTGKAD